MKLESALAKNTKQVATSLGCPALPMGVEWNPSKSSLVIVDTTNGVQMGPGATALTRMPLPQSWLDRERVKAMIAPFVEV
jgi:hypothetical protein